MINAINQSNAFAMPALITPMGTASADNNRTRRSVRKSASNSRRGEADGDGEDAVEEECKQVDLCRVTI